MSIVLQFIHGSTGSIYGEQYHIQNLLPACATYTPVLGLYVSLPLVGPQLEDVYSSDYTIRNGRFTSIRCCLCLFCTNFNQPFFRFPPTISPYRLHLVLQYLLHRGTVSVLLLRHLHVEANQHP